jgi:hypothetical protein
MAPLGTYKLQRMLEGGLPQALQTPLEFLFAKRLGQGALVVFDDVHWSNGMWQAWQVLKEQEGFGYTIDLGRLGICLWEGNSTLPVHYDLRPYTGWLRKVSAQKGRD